ncbi:Uncharacterised protein [uncultured archaeon]|nr:Uncharacterised protein [uncultured archaeon]
MENKEHLEILPPKITEKRIWNLNNFFVALIIGLIIIFCFFVIIAYFDPTILTKTMLFAFFVIIYAIILFFLLEPRIIQEVNQTSLRTITNPIIKEVVVEKQVQIPYETEKKIYITNVRSPRPNIPKYDYVGSFQTGTYHKRSCRLSKLIKNKYKILNNDPNYFIKNNYKPCLVCIKHQKKI